MNFLNKFFSGGNKNQKPSLLISDPKIKEDFESKSIEDIPSFDEEKMRNFNNIFSDDRGPETEVNQDIDPINQFFEKSIDYEKKGENDGEFYHDDSIRRAYVSRIISDFTNYLDSFIIKKEDFRSKIVYELSGLSDSESCPRIKAKISSLDLEIDRLKEQKELASKSEGMISKAINEYESGFDIGVNKYKDSILSNYLDTKF